MIMEAEVPLASLKLDNVASFASILLALKAGAKQVCNVTLGVDGLWIRWEDESKSLQSSFYVRAELFSAYCCPGSLPSFGIHFPLLVDTLAVFSSTHNGVLDMHYPGPDGELVFRMQETEPGGLLICTYSQVTCLDLAASNDLLDYWQEPVSYFIAPGAMVKEAIEDLEWPAGPVEVLMQSNPPRLAMQSKGTAGELEVELSTLELRGFHCTLQEVRHTYKYKNLRIAFTNIPSQKDAFSISTKVSVDAQGMLKVTHMVPFHSTGRSGPVPTQGDPLDTQGVGQRSVAGVHTCTIQFVMLPLEEEAMV